jgi:enoyl-CoA hydratase/carnithine racemase
MGLAARVVPNGAALTEALALAEDLAQHSRDALANVKRSLLAVRESRRGTSLAAETEVFTQAWGSPAHVGAFAALSKRR